MHDTAAAGGYPLDSSADGGPQLEPTTPGLRGRRLARRPDAAETQSTPPAPGPFNGARRRQDDRRDFAADRGRRRSARPPAWVGRPAHPAERKRPPPVADRYLHELEQRVTTTQLTRTRRPSRGSRPLPQPTRLRAQTGRDPPLAQRRLGTHRSPSQGWTQKLGPSYCGLL
jgi:hypothetical protein